jgi:serine/threonine-protein kinase RsbW
VRQCRRVMHYGWRSPSRQIRTIQGFLSTRCSGPIMMAVLQTERSSLNGGSGVNAMSPNARKLLLHRDLAELDRLAVWIEGWAMRDLSASLSFAVQVCLEEAVANIIMYSATTDDRLEIVIEVEHGDQTLIARIEDNGSAFDPTQVPRPPVPPSLAEAKVGNLGIHLMRSFASCMYYERLDSRNRLTMRFVEVQDAAHGATMR